MCSTFAFYFVMRVVGVAAVAAVWASSAVTTTAHRFVATSGPLSVLWTYDTKPESYNTVSLGDGIVVAGTTGLANCRSDVFSSVSGKLQVR